MSKYVTLTTLADKPYILGLWKLYWLVWHIDVDTME